MKYIVLLSVLALGACASWQGKEYSVRAYNSQGKLLSKNFQLDSNQAGIPIARDSLCKAHPNATIRVHNKVTKQEQTEYSPYLCRRNRR